MARRIPPLHWLRAFEAAARHMSFTAAARELNVTQSAVSQQVRLLEAHLGHPLFHRLPRGLQLTERGQAYLPTLREAFERLAAGTAEVFGTAAGQPLTVKVTAGFAALWLAPRLKRFLAAHPEVELSITHSIWPADFALGSIDLEVRYGTGHWPGLRADRLTWERLFPVCSPALAAGDPPLRTPADLAGHTLLHSVGFQDGWPQWLALAGVDGAVDAGRGVHLDTSIMTLALAAEGAGVALARSSFVERELDGGRLVAPFDLVLPTEEAFYVVTPEEPGPHPNAAVFRDWLLQEAEAARTSA